MKTPPCGTLRSLPEAPKSTGKALEKRRKSAGKNGGSRPPYAGASSVRFRCPAASMMMRRAF
ncbi:MAG: hypothetical protein WC989_04655 [Micavibrio sp.]